MLRMTDNNAGGSGGGGNENEFISIDQKKRQITFIEPSSSSSAAAAIAGENANSGDASTSLAAAAALDRGPMVSAPKIFAFDGLFTSADSQVSGATNRFKFIATHFSFAIIQHFPSIRGQNDVCTATLQDVIPAVLDGIDGCVLALGHPKSGN